MLKNFIVTSDLKKYYPNIDDNLWPSTSDFDLQIDLAFSRLEQDLLIKGIDTRLIMIPYVLSSALSVSSSHTSDWFMPSSEYKRLYVKTENSISTDNTFKIQGSHDKTTIYDITTLTINGNGTDTIVLTELYKYYRIVITGTALNATTELYETGYDDAIIHCAFTFIYRDFMKEIDDMWDVRRKFAEQDYSSILTSLKVLYDSNDDLDPSNDTIVDIAEPYFYR